MSFPSKILTIALALASSPCYGQVETIVFAAPSTTMATATPAAQNCRCVPAGTCPPSTTTNFDVRIVNGVPGGCVYGQEWCCQKAEPQVTTVCGIRKITNAPAQPSGTAKYGAYPWQAMLFALDNTYVGSGVLISPEWVLTVAHKVAPYPNRNFLVRLGEWDSANTNEPNPYQTYTPVQVITHPSYNNVNFQNDIALIKLDRRVPLSTSPNINTACTVANLPPAGTRCWVSGWGTNAFGAAGQLQSIMREVDVPIMDPDTCQTRLRGTRLGAFFELNRTSFMCAGGEFGKDACTGDGGAPLVCESNTGQWSVVGLVSWGIGCAGNGVPGVYVNVPSYLPWIRQQTGM